MTNQPHKCGYVALLGRPNVGKSTLLNRILGQKISITSRRPQTTRHRILGIRTGDGFQAVYLDTPGVHQGGKKAMNRYMNRAATTSIEEADVIIFLVDGMRWTEEDQLVVERLAETDKPVILAVNKVDKVKEKGALLPHLQELATRREFADVIPLSARDGTNLEALEEKVAALLPESEPFYPEDQVTDRSLRFLAAELIREKLTRKLGQELPYALTVEIEQFKEEGKLTRIAAVILVDRPGQKAIVIGKGGATLKAVGQEARLDMEKNFERKIFLQLWVKVREGWADDERALQSLGYTDH
ncbi:GTPase Era [Endothiovibrio diazotrophicus]